MHQCPASAWSDLKSWDLTSFYIQLSVRHSLTDFGGNFFHFLLRNISHSKRIGIYLIADLLLSVISKMHSEHRMMGMKFIPRFFKTLNIKFTTLEFHIYMSADTAEFLVIISAYPVRILYICKFKLLVGFYRLYNSFLLLFGSLWIYQCHKVSDSRLCHDLAEGYLHALFFAEIEDTHYLEGSHSQSKQILIVTDIAVIGKSFSDLIFQSIMF